MNYIPDRKIWAGGLSGIAAWAVLQVLAHYNVTLPNPPFSPEGLAAVIGWIASYLIPPSMQDKVKRLNDDVVNFAKNSPEAPAEAKEAVRK
jgi:hypothetical protein